MRSHMRMQERLLTYQELSEQIGLPVRTLRHLVTKGVIPRLVLGHKLIRFQPSRVQKALQKREVKEAQ
jgi:excisionase family DNA binding protein